MLVGGVTGIVAPGGSLDWRVGAAALFGLGAALVLDEFALILHLKDVYWSSAGRLSVEAVFVAVAITVLLLLGVFPSVVTAPGDRHASTAEAVTGLILSVVLTFGLAAITLLKGKIWTGLFGLFLFPLLHRGRDPAGPARLTVGPLAVPEPAAQAGPRGTPGAATTASRWSGSGSASRISCPACRSTQTRTRSARPRENRRQSK